MRKMQIRLSVGKLLYWMLSLTDSLESPTLNLMLSLPNEALARHYAGRWPQVREVLARDILAALRL